MAILPGGGVGGKGGGWLPHGLAESRGAGLDRSGPGGELAPGRVDYSGPGTISAQRSPRSALEAEERPALITFKRRNRPVFPAEQVGNPLRPRVPDRKQEDFRWGTQPQAQFAEVIVLCDDDKPVPRRPVPDGPVGPREKGEIQNVHTVRIQIAQEADKAGAQVFVEEQPHAAGGASLRSPAAM